MINALLNHFIIFGYLHCFQCLEETNEFILEGTFQDHNKTYPALSKLTTSYKPSETDPKDFFLLIKDHSSTPYSLLSLLFLEFFLKYLKPNFLFLISF